MERLRDELSEREIGMFEQLGKDVAERIADLLDEQVTVAEIYRIAVDEAFISNARGFAVDSLRRTYLALLRENPSRRTDKFEALIFC